MESSETVQRSVLFVQTSSLDATPAIENVLKEAHAKKLNICYEDCVAFNLYTLLTSETDEAKEMFFLNHFYPLVSDRWLQVCKLLELLIINNQQEGSNINLAFNQKTLANITWLIRKLIDLGAQGLDRLMFTWIQSLNGQKNDGSKLYSDKLPALPSSVFALVFVHLIEDTVRFKVPHNNKFVQYLLEHHWATLKDGLGNRLVLNMMLVIDKESFADCWKFLIRHLNAELLRQKPTIKYHVFLQPHLKKAVDYLVSVSENKKRYLEWLALNIKGDVLVLRVLLHYLIVLNEPEKSWDIALWALNQTASQTDADWLILELFWNIIFSIDTTALPLLVLFHAGPRIKALAERMKQVLHAYQRSLFPPMNAEIRNNLKQALQKAIQGGHLPQGALKDIIIVSDVTETTIVSLESINESNNYSVYTDKIVMLLDTPIGVESCEELLREAIENKVPLEELERLLNSDPSVEPCWIKALGKVMGAL